MGRAWLALLAGLCALCAVAQASQECKNKVTCSQCIQTPNCIWCGHPGNFTEESGKEMTRCVKRTDEGVSQWRAICGTEHVYDLTNFFDLIDNEELTQAGVLAGSGGAAGGAGAAGGSWGVGSGEAVVQIKPQRVFMQLRVQESYSMDVTFRQAEDYPVDLYYLMDLSKSMEDDKESLSLLGAQLAEEMQKITKNFRLGFGSFVDKVVMPYVSTVPEKLEAPCPLCARPYGFKNALPLTTNADSFEREVRNAPVSGNLDAPEGGFDAIMQAIVCQKEINWRQEARRLLVFSTDAGFHYAGDGKLGGIVKPNDGECHLDPNFGNYTHSTLQDYPSVSQINQVAKQHKMNLIFAVTAEQSSVYKQLSKMIEGSGHGELTADSSNVVELVKQEYEKITSKIELKDNATAPVSIRYFSKCKSNTEKETSVCQGLKVGDQVDFRVEITVEKCPKERKDWLQTIGIYPVGLRELLAIELEMLCDCACEREGNAGYISNASECSGFGIYQCGVCRCDEGFLGSRCECGANTTLGADGTFDESGCRETNTSAVCSGRGSCTCGECKCNERDDQKEVVIGKFCQCTNFLCNRFNGVLCGGSDHGECDCNVCKCKPGWKGEACMCEDSKDNCFNPASGEVCSNRGDCECNQCKCKENENGRYSGKWCEDCPTCKGKCVPYKPCVQCKFFQTGELSKEECDANCTMFNATEVPVAVFKCPDFKECVQCRVHGTGPLAGTPQCSNCSILHSRVSRILANYTILVTDWVQAVEESGERLCSFFDENDCRFKFVYGYDENKEPVVRVQRTLECPPKLDILGIVLGVIGAIVAVGLALLLMWKVLTSIHDKREFARFEKERMMARWDTGENPIYKQATSTFKNPMYGGK